jgi:hypothetical protein
MQEQHQQALRYKKLSILFISFVENNLKELTVKSYRK